MYNIILNSKFWIVNYFKANNTQACTKNDMTANWLYENVNVDENVLKAAKEKGIKWPKRQ